MGLKSRFEEHHGIRYEAAALEAAVELSARHINDRHLPDKAIDVIDEAGANLRLIPVANRSDTVTVELSREDRGAHGAHSGQAGVAVGQGCAAEARTQPQAGRSSARTGRSRRWRAAIKMARSGLREEDKPIGAFLFAGPTGVGKTEVTRQLAMLMGVELIRFDMSEYMERHTVSRMIGAPPGYVGFDQGGLLTEAITKHPYSVLLLDEIEKAHPDVFNLLLQVMDHGTLTDNNGRKADFRNAIIVMTTNAGAQEMSRASIGFAQPDNAADGAEAIKRLFSPEFRNRIDAIIQFAPLDMPVIERVVDKLVLEIEASSRTTRSSLELDDAARPWIAEKGYDPKMGARPMARIIQEEIKRPLAEELLFGSLEQGGHVKITVGKDGNLELLAEPVLKELAHLPD